MNRITLTHLRVFCEVADCLSVTRAASRLFRTQPAVSRQLSELETDLGLALFIRQGRSLLLTSEGKDLLARARAMIMSADDLGARAQELAGGSAATLRIGAMTASLEGVLPAMVDAYRKQFPRVTLRLVDVDTRDLLAQIEAGEVDLAFGRDASSDSVASKRLFPMHLVALIAAGNSLAKCAAIEVSELQREPLLLTPSGTGSRVLLEQVCRADGLTLRDIRMESRAYSGLIAMAQAGCGIAVTLSTVVSNRPKTKLVPIHHHGQPLSVWFSAMWHRRRVQPYATAFLTLAEQVTSLNYPGKSIRTLTRAPATKTSRC